MFKKKINKPKSKIYKINEEEQESEKTKLSEIKSIDCKDNIFLNNKLKKTEFFQPEFTTKDNKEMIFKKTNDSKPDDLFHKEKSKDINEINKNEKIKQYELSEQTVEYENKKEIKDLYSCAGPLKSSKNIRVTCRFDYAGGICKDFKETGYCGYGDGCIFIHDRGDYKTGWELENDWNKMQREKALINDKK